MIHILRSEDRHFDFNEIDEIGNIRDILWKAHYDAKSFSVIWLRVSDSEHEVRNSIRDELDA